MEIITLLFLLFTKHFVVDFILQTEYQWSNKGKFLHPGGVLHSFLHGISSFFIMKEYIDPELAYEFSLIEGCVHYLIDWSKVNINEYFEWKSNTSPKFWYLLGFDQYLHSLTYLLMGYFSLQYINL